MIGCLPCALLSSLRDDNDCVRNSRSSSSSALQIGRAVLASFCTARANVKCEALVQTAEFAGL